MSLMFPAIYRITLQGLNAEESKIGAAEVVLVIVGGVLILNLPEMTINAGALV